MRKSKGQRPGKSDTVVIRIRRKAFELIKRWFPKHSFADVVDVWVEVHRSKR